MKNNKYPISIITICRNEPFIEATCKSIIGQTNQNFEWVVVHGASTDGTIDTLRKYINRMDIFISEADNGVYDAMNKGIAAAHGEYLLFMNGGDMLYDTDTIERIIPFLSNHDECVFYGDSYRLFDTPEDCFIKTYPETITKDFFLTNTLGHQSCFIHHKLFKRHGPYRTDFKIVSDKEKWLKLISAKEKFYHIPFACSKFRMNGVSRNKTPELKKEKFKLLTQYFSQEQLYNSNEPYLKDIFGQASPCN